MHNHHLLTTARRRLLVGATAAAVLGLGATQVAAATATTEPGEPMTSEPMTSEPMTSDHSDMDMTAGSLVVDGSAEASSPEAEAFCAAEVATELAFASGDPAQIGPASEALVAAAPADVAETVQAVLDNAESQGPEFEAAYAELIAYMQANCGYAEIEVQMADYSFAGIPSELPAGGLIITAENVGEELHVVDLFRINDDVTLTAEEILALPEEEAFAAVTQVGSAFAAPGAIGYGTAELTPGRYLAICPIPQGLTPEIAAQFEEGGPPASAPAGSAPTDSAAPATATASEGTAPMGTEPMGTEPMGTEPMGSEPMGSEPMGSGPGGPELGPPHFVLGMWQEVTVV